MSVYNGEEYLEIAIKSVIEQTYDNWELIIINDCSSDNTAQILNEYKSIDSRIKVYTNETNMRLPKSLNKAIDLCNGKYIARMDADDICLPQRISKQVEFMEANNTVSLSSCRFYTLKNGKISSGGCGGKNDNTSIMSLLAITNPILHPGIIAKSSVIKQLRYNPSYTCTEDYELWTRFAMNGYKIAVIPEFLMIYRLHDKQITATTSERQAEEVLRIHKEYYRYVADEIPQELEKIYINGIYFSKLINISDFLKFSEWFKKSAINRKRLTRHSIDYVLVEILAEHKRKGASFTHVIKGMRNLNTAFLIFELTARKIRSYKDGIKCIKTAEKLGLVHVSGSKSFPEFVYKTDRS